jgi:LacI family transcriptional regulator
MRRSEGSSQSAPVKVDSLGTVSELEQSERSATSIEAASRLLRGERKTRADTSQRVRALAEKRERPKDIRVIGVALIVSAHLDIRHPFFGEVLDGLRQRAAAGRYDLLLFSGREPSESTVTYSFVERCRSHNVDGIVVMGLGQVDPSLEEILAAEIPCVTVDLDVLGARCGYVMSDNIDGARQVVRHLASLGRRRLALITGIGSSRVSIDRAFGFRTELDSLGLPIDDDYVAEGDFYEESGYEVMGELLALPEPPDGVFCASDMMAVGAIRRIQEAGLEVPYDIAVAGFDDAPFASLTRPTLTTVRQDKAGLGAAAGEALLRIIEQPDQSPPILTLPVELVVRESTVPGAED